MSQRMIIITLFLTVYTGTVFAAWSGIDIMVATWFFTDGSFLGGSTPARLFRKIFFYLPVLIMLWLLAAWAARYAAAQCRPLIWLARFAPSTKVLIFSAITLALGPGLLVNMGLKEHWSRPRPVHVQEFGGSAQFMPWWRTDGSCRKNCSFVSGEVSGAFWLVAPASFAPPPVRTLAVAAAMTVGLVTALGRVAFGGHFLSDAIFAALLTLLVCQGVYFFMFGRHGGTQPPN